MVERELIVGLVIERLEPSSQWGEPIWLPVQVLDGVPDAPAWTVLEQKPDRVRYFAGAFVLHLYSTDTAFYRDNLLTGRPQLWVVMQPDAAAQRVEIVTVTADPTEGEGFTQTGTSVVEVVDMPPGAAGEIAAFVEQHHVERVFEKRKRDKRQPKVLEQRPPIDRGRS